MEKVTITEKDILNANTSMPLTLKWTLAKYIAEITLEKKNIVIKENGEETIPLPDMAQRRTMMETQLKIGVFVKEYMRYTFDPVRDSVSEKEIPYMMAADEADKWSNFEAQLDRLKRSKTPGVADKCYDILNDYHAFVRMVSIEIEQELQVRNDPVGRSAWLLSSIVGGVANGFLKDNLKELSHIAEELEKEGENGAAASEGESTEE